MSLRASLCALVMAVFVLFVLSTEFATSSQAEESQDIQIRIQFESMSSKDMIKDLATMHLDIVYETSDYLDIFVSPEELAELEDRGFKPEVVHESVSAFYRSRLDASKDMGGYHTLSEIEAYIDTLYNDHGGMISQKISIGQTHEGRNQWAFKLSDNPEVDEDEPEVLYTAAIHAREVITPLVLRHFLEHMTNGYGIDPEVTELVDSREIWIVLCVNPDGYYHNELTNPNGGGQWRKNRRNNGDGTFGVDLNRNYGYQWGYDNDGSSPFTSDPTYRGPSAFSEPESQNMRDFTIAHEFVITVYFHSYSNLVLYPWGYDYLITPDDDIFSVLADSCALWNGYDPGPAHGLYKANGVTDDWGYGEQVLKNKNFAMTFEVGSSSDGFWPSTSRIPQLVSENLEPLLFLTRMAGTVFQLRAPEAPVISVDPIVDGQQYTVAWSHEDTLNPAVAFELVELQGPTIGENPADDFSGWSNAGYSISATRFQSAPSSFFSGSDDNLANRMTSVNPYLVQAGDTLRFWTWYDIEDDWDYGYVEVSTDGAVFTPIAGNITTTSNPNGNNRGNGITYTSDWVLALFDLSSYVGQEVFFRFSYETDVSVQGDGWWIDDVYPYQTYETITVVSSSLTDTSYTFTEKPGGDYYYRVRAKDAEDQWGSFSETVQTTVITDGVGDVDLDGVAHSVSDAALFAMYFHRGLGEFTVDQEQQIGQTDINCDGLTLTPADRDQMLDVMLGSADPCSPPGKADGNADAKVIQRDDPAYNIRLGGGTYIGYTSTPMTILLDQGNGPILGFKFAVEYNHTELELVDVTPDFHVNGWDYFDYIVEPSGDFSTVTVAGLAWVESDSTTEDETGSSPNRYYVVFDFRVVDSASQLTSDVNFVWNRCGDNTIAVGAWPGPTSQLLALSNQVFDADETDITGLDPLYGGRAAHCDDGYLGAAPVPGIDFHSGRITYYPSCCTGYVGNVDCDPDDNVTLGDLTALIDNLFISLEPVCCEPEAQIDGQNGISLGDLTVLIDVLFISLAPPPNCSIPN